MQVEGVIILGKTGDVLFSCGKPTNDISWDVRVNDIVEIAMSWDSEDVSFLLYDDVAIGVILVGELKIVVSAPISSDLAVEASMDKALSLLGQVVKLACKETCTQQVLMAREYYVRLQLLMQDEITTSGRLRLIDPATIDI